uniref:Nuclear receptor n=1 Tax=Brachionus rotundiformis TaxID=96890 RepID=A0A221CAV4_9BILA|nr:nuclear receptor [Brachionus rotundiformis]
MENNNGATSVQQMQSILLRSIQIAIDSSNKITSDSDRCHVDSQKLESNLIDTGSQVLTESEKQLIKNLCQVVQFSRRKNPIDLNRKQDFLDPNQSKDKLKHILANFLATPVKRVVTFAQYLPDFTQLEPEDRINLLKEATIGITISASSSLYDFKSNKFRNMISKDENIYTDSSNLDLSVMKAIWSEELFTKTIDFLKSLSELCFDEACLALFLSIILFSSETIDHKNQESVTNILNKYSYLLRKYMRWKMGEKGEKSYNMLLSKLPEIKYLGELHVSFIQDVDPKKIDNFLLAFVFSKKKSKLNRIVDETQKEGIKYEL